MSAKGQIFRNTPSTAGNSMTSSERPSPEPLLKKRPPQPYRGGDNSGNALEASNAFNYRAWGIPAILSTGIPGKALRAFPVSFRNFSWISSGKSQPYWGCGLSISVTKEQPKEEGFWAGHPVDTQADVRGRQFWYRQAVWILTTDRPLQTSITLRHGLALFKSPSGGGLTKMGSVTFWGPLDTSFLFAQIVGARWPQKTSVFGPQNLALCEVLGSKCDKNKCGEYSGKFVKLVFAR